MTLKHCISNFLAVLIALPAIALAEDDGDHIRLIAALDEPEFYCFDIAGWGKSLQLDDPLQTHTCKHRGGEDQMFRFANGRIVVAMYDRCVQVAGSSDVTLAGSAVLARTCSDSPMQQFSLDDDGRIRITDTEYCLVAGPDSTNASGPSHLWRTLTVGDCNTSNTKLSTWQIGLAN